MNLYKRDNHVTENKPIRWDKQQMHNRMQKYVSHLLFIHQPLILSAPPPRLLIDFKNRKRLTYFCILLCICYCFSHLIGIFSVTWLSPLYKFTRFFIYFLFLSDEGPMLETLDYILSVLAVHRPLYISISISTLPTQQTAFI